MKIYFLLTSWYYKPRRALVALPIGLSTEFTIILSVVLCGCEAWSLILREELRLRVFENRISTRIFGPQLGCEWGVERLHNEKINILYHSPNIVRMIKSRRFKWAGHVAKMEEGRSAFKILTGKPSGKIPLGRPRRTQEDNIRMDIKKYEELG